jgi:lipoyl-dependent peroxiredoxin
MQRKANARWQGTAKEGGGTLSVQSGTLKEVPYTFKARFGDGKGTNPEELIAAAHAGCFTMALSFALNNAGYTADAIDTEAQLTMDQVGGGWSITAVHLLTRARVPNIEATKFQEIAAGAKANCPVSRVLNATITLDASLVG